MKLRLQPGTNLWLLAHELRLQLRGVMTNKTARNWTIASIGLLVLFGAAVSIPIALLLRGTTLVMTPYFAMGVLAAGIVLSILMLSQTVSAASQTLFERNDLDLLFSSPIPPRVVLMVRCVGIAGVALIFPLCFLGVPIAVFGLLVDWLWLGVYLALISLAVVATLMGLSLAIVLSHWIGPLKTRAMTRVLGAIFGMAIALGVQVLNFNHGLRGTVSASFVAWSGSDLLKDGHVLNTLALALIGRNGWLLVMAVMCLGVFVALIRRWGDEFADLVARANGMRSKPNKAKRAQRYRFSANPSVTLVRKELRLLLRKPDLLIQSLIQSTALLPAIAVPLMATDRGSAYYVAGGASWLVYLAATLAGSLAWLIHSAEDSPDLIGSVPVAPETVIRAKTLAALLPVAAILVPLVIFVATLSPWIAAACLVGSICAGYGAAQIEIWHRKPAPRTSFGARRPVSIAVTLGQALLALSCAAASFLAAIGSWAWLIPAFIGFGTMVILRPDKLALRAA